MLHYIWIRPLLFQFLVYGGYYSTISVLFLIQGFYTVCKHCRKSAEETNTDRPSSALEEKYESDRQDLAPQNIIEQSALWIKITSPMLLCVVVLMLLLEYTKTVIVYCIICIIIYSPSIFACTVLWYHFLFTLLCTIST